MKNVPVPWRHCQIWSGEVHKAVNSFGGYMKWQFGDHFLEQQILYRATSFSGTLQDLAAGEDFSNNLQNIMRHLAPSTAQSSAPYMPPAVSQSGRICYGPD